MEDSQEDAELLLRELRRAGYGVVPTRVDTAAGLSAALNDRWDVITCDWKLPGFDGQTALELIRTSGSEAPVIIVSGEIGEEFAVIAMRAGARDFVSKHRLARLAPAVERELREAEERRARRRTEDALRATEQRFRAFIENTSDQVAVVDAEGIYRYVSPSHLDACGYAPEELLGTHAYELIHPDDLRVLLTRYAEGLRQGTTRGFAEFRVRHKDGSWRVIEATVRNLLDDPLVRGLLINGRDVTARREMEDTLRLQSAVLVNLAEGVALIRVGDRTIVHANPEFESMFGYDPGELHGLHASVLYVSGGLGAAEAFDEISAALENDGSWSGELRSRRKDGGEFWSTARISKFSHPEYGDVWIAVLSDITPRREADEALRQRIALQEQLEKVAETSPGVLFSFVLRPDGTSCIPYASAAMLRVYELDPADVREDASAFFGRVHPEDLAGVLASIAESALTMTPWRHVFRGLMPHQSEMWLEGHSVPQHQPDGSILWHGVVVDITEQRRAAEEARRSEGRYRALFHNMLDGYAMCRMIFEEGVGRDFVYLEVNDAFERLTGLREVVGKRATEVIPGIREESPEVLEFYARVVRSREPSHFESYVRPLKRWFSVSAYAAGDDCFVAVFDNITEAKKAEAHTALQTTALRAAANAIVITDRDGSIVWANPAFTRLTGYGLDEAMGQNPRLLKSGWQDASFYTALWETICSGRVWSGQVVNKRKDGTLYTEEMTITPVIAEGGEVTHFIAVKQDVTERQRAEEERRRHAEHYRAITSASLDGFWRIDCDGHLLDVNDAYCALSGYTREELLQMWIGDLEAVERPMEIRSHIAELRRRGSDRFETRHRHRDGHLVDVEVNCLYVPESGQILAFLRDITEAKRAGEEIRALNADLEQRVASRTAELEATNRELEAFSYSVSHDLRAPLRSIDGFSRLLIEEFGTGLPEEAQRYLETICGSAERMGQLIAALLSLSRLGRQPLQRHTVDTAAVVRDVIAELQPTLEGRLVDLRLGELPPCRADPTLLRQVWLNLLANALKYTAKRAAARVDVGCLRDGGADVYFVRDNGAGFDMRYADHLFGVFQRLHSAAQFEGTGVGLAIVQRIIHRHGGRVWAEAGENRGATFYFTLEAAPASSAA